MPGVRVCGLLLRGLRVSAWCAMHGNGGPVRGVSTKISPLPGTSVARSVCHQCCCHHHHRDDHRGGGGVAPGHMGKLTRIVPFELADAVLDAQAGAPAAGAAVPGRGCTSC